MKDFPDNHLQEMLDYGNHPWIQCQGHGTTDAQEYRIVHHIDQYLLKMQLSSYYYHTPACPQEHISDDA